MTLGSEVRYDWARTVPALYIGVPLVMAVSWALVFVIFGLAGGNTFLVFFAILLMPIYGAAAGFFVAAAVHGARFLLRTREPGPGTDVLASVLGSLVVALALTVILLFSPGWSPAAGFALVLAPGALSGFASLRFFRARAEAEAE